MPTDVTEIGFNQILENPALLDRKPGVYLSSLFSANLRNLNYTLGGGSFPIWRGSLGVGYLATNRPNVNDGGLIRDDQQLGEGSDAYYNNVLLVSYGSPLTSSLFRYPLFSPLRLGGSLKYFTQGFRSGTSTTTGKTASGFDLDLGVHIPINPFLEGGITFNNLLPNGLGGNLHWSDGSTTGIPLRIVGGTTISLFGKQGLLGKRELTAWDAEFDAILSPTVGDPLLFRANTAWIPYPNWELRGGFKQVVEGTEFKNFFTFGTSYTSGRLSYHYAAESPSQSLALTHFFSMSYHSGTEEKPRELEKTYINLILPADKSIVKKPWADVVGEVLQPEVRSILDNETVIPVKKNRFVATHPIPKPGKHVANIRAINQKGEVVTLKKLRLIYLLSFADVPNQYWAHHDIENLATLQWLSGYPDGTFRPEKGITQIEFSILLGRIQTTYDAATIQQFFSKMEPRALVTRREGVSVLTRTTQLSIPKEFLYKPFADVDQSLPYFREVYAAKEAGILDFLYGKMFEANHPLSRAEVATMIARTSQGKEAINKLFNWEAGF